MLIKTNSLRRKIFILSLVFLILILIMIVGIYFSKSRFNIVPHFIASHNTIDEAINFPVIETASLSPVQKKLVSTLQEEYNLQSDGTKYSEGIVEPWCADFVSWVLNESGAPLKNPHTGYWRIPGTYTLREYYESVGKFAKADNNYTPKLGDVMIYDNPSSFGQHTNIVIEYNDGIVTTVGGNEYGRIRISKHKFQEDNGFIGFGVL